MDFDHGNVSVLQGDKLFFNKVISRSSSVGCSSRVFYNRNNEGVPFKWEMQPGTPKDPPKQEVIPPLSPPPALLSLGLPKPCIQIEEPKPSMRSRLKLYFLKHVLKSKRITETQAMSCRSNAEVSSPGGSDKLEGYDLFFYSSDGEFMASPRGNSSASSSPTLSFSHSRQSLRLDSLPRDSIHEAYYGCSPWNFTSVLRLVAKQA